MPTLVLDDTPGGATSNTYCSREDADVYHSAHIALDAWDGLSDDVQDRALAHATRLLDEWYEWDGFVASSDQALLWPRDGVVGPNGYEEASDEIPTRIREATAELARQLTVGDRTADSDIESQRIKRVKAGSVEVEFGPGVSAKVIPDAVHAMVGVYGTKRMSGGGSVKVQRA